MTKIYPFVKFNDSKCREGMTFYKDALGGELEFMTGKDTPMAAELGDKVDLIMHATLTKGDFVIIGSDMMQDKAVMGDGTGIFLECEGEEEINSVYAKLSEGGEVFMPLEKQFWGAYFAVITDKYGVEWQLNYQIK